MLYSYNFLGRSYGLLLNFFWVLDLLKLTFIKDFKFFKFMNKLFFFLMDKLYKLEVIGYGLISEKAHHKILIDLEIVIIDFDHK